MADDITQKCYKSLFMIEGTNDPVYMSKMTGTNVRTEKVHFTAKSRGKKNKKVNIML